MLGSLMSALGETYMVLERASPLNSTNPSDERPAVEMVGRTGGLFGLLLSFFGLADTITIRVTPGEARLTRASKLGGGESIHIVSLQAKPSVLIAVSSGIPWLVLAVLLGLAGGAAIFLFFPASLGLFILAGACVLGFIFGRAYSVHIVGFTSLRFRIFPSLTGKGNLSFKRLMEAIDLMRRLIDQVEVKTQVGNLPAPAIVPTQGTAQAVVAQPAASQQSQEELAARAYYLVLSRAPEPGRDPVAFLQDLLSVMHGYPGTAAAARAEHEWRGLAWVSQMLQDAKANTLPRDSLWSGLEQARDEYLDCVAGTWAGHFLSRRK